MVSKWYWRQPDGGRRGLLHSIWETFMLHDLTVEVSVDPMVAVMLWQESEAVMYMCCSPSIA